jgi:ABC-2 type transport system ATP-binding protein
VLWLEQSYLRDDGPAREVVAEYRHSVESQSELEAATTDGFRIGVARTRRPDGAQPSTYEPLQVDFSIFSPKEQDAHVYVGITEGTAPSIFTCATETTLEEGETRLACTFDHLPLPRGSYSVWACVMDREKRFDLSPWHPIGSFDVMGPEPEEIPRAIVRVSAVQVHSTWEIGPTSG